MGLCAPEMCSHFDGVIPSFLLDLICPSGGMAVTPDSKSGGRKVVRVRFSWGAPCAVGTTNKPSKPVE